MPWRAPDEAAGDTGAAALRSANRRQQYQQAFAHLLERGDSVQNAWLLRREMLAGGEVVCLISEHHYYVIRSGASSTAAEVLLFGPLGVEARVERQGLRFFLVLEERRLPLKRSAVRDARALAAAIAAPDGLGPTA
jgi:hypothetical protein